MRISKIKIQNFRNFKDLEVPLSDKVVVLGENAVGKTNFIDALRLVLDRSFRPQLGESDFHNNASVPKFRGTIIQVDVFFEDFTSEQDKDFLAVLQGDCFCQDNPPVAQISFQYRPKTIYLDDLDSATSPEYYESVWYGGGNLEKTKIAIKFRERVDLRVVKALRDIDGDLNSWQRSPLRKLTKTMNLASQPKFQDVAQRVQRATNELRKIEPIRELQEKVQTRLVNMIEGVHAFDPKIGMLPTNPDELQKYLTFLVENDLSLDRTSLGLANILYLTLLMVEIELLRESGGEDTPYQYTILSIDEPEAHLHPHLQRLVFRDFLKSNLPVILSTHSPNIVSIAEPDWFVLLSKKDGETKGISTANLTTLSDDVKRDLSRYLDVNRGETVFAKGVILVEGDAEGFLIPEFAKKMRDAKFINNTLDGAGISVVNVSGTDFTPYIRFFGPEGLSLPLAVITDGDRFVGLSRKVKGLLNSDQLDDDQKQELQLSLNESDIHGLRDILENRGIFYYEGLERGVKIVEIIAPHDAKTNDLLPELLNNYDQGNWDELRKGLQHPNIGIFVNDWTLEDELVSVGYMQELLDVYRELGASDVQVENMRKELDKGLIPKVIKRIETSGKGKGRFAQRLADRLDVDRIPIYIQEAIQHVILRVPQISKPVSVQLYTDINDEEE
ncbi:MAG: AAA family ATPase [Ardenticatenaceae bacterium]|nr:AAA family ATPase [Ardenticatenaceae bacterium]MCB9444985.1 AAA family ATPase [Ardenticatenaceae bacterium]